MKTRMVWVSFDTDRKKRRTRLYICCGRKPFRQKKKILKSISSSNFNMKNRLTIDVAVMIGNQHRNGGWCTGDRKKCSRCHFNNAFFRYVKWKLSNKFHIRFIPTRDGQTKRECTSETGCQLKWKEWETTTKQRKRIRNATPINVHHFHRTH